ncbi:MAG: GC-type dockerin domain-anchored protein [Planctomycetota bacterium]
MKRACALMAAAAATAAHGQVVINEIFQNPPGSGSSADVFYEYIELYGEPGLDLTGYAIALFKGGADDGDDIPETVPEIDEAYSLDGLSIGANGFLVIANDNSGFSEIGLLTPAAATFAGFSGTHIPSTDTPGNLANGDSSTYLLVRRRPLHSVVNGMSVYAPGYAFRKDPNPDIDFDGKLDFGIEAGGSAEMLDPLQIVDEVAWSDNGGKEYVRSSEQEISDTPGFDPDALSRQAYFGTNPMLGLRLDSMNATVPTRTADEEWVYGDMTPTLVDLEYDPLETGAPTDPAGDGFADIDVTGFTLTPGDFNDAAGLTQFRFVRGDFDFDGVVTEDDASIISASLGRHLDELSDCLDEMGMPIIDPSTSQPFQCWVEGRELQGIMAMRRMDPADGVGGANADDVTQSDIDAFNTEFPFAPDCIGDVTTTGATLPGQPGFGEPDGAADLDDLGYFLGFFLVNDASVADLTSTGATLDGQPGFGIPDSFVDIDDLGYFLNFWLQGCS